MWNYGRIAVLAVSLVTLVASSWLVFRDQEMVLAKSTTADSRQVWVLSRSWDRLDGWSVKFCWEYEDSVWALYYLDHESDFWDHVTLKASHDIISVHRADQMVGWLDVQNRTFFHVQKPRSGAHGPLAVVIGETPASGMMIYPGHRDWELVWNEKPDDNGHER